MVKLFKNIFSIFWFIVNWVGRSKEYYSPDFLRVFLGIHTLVAGVREQPATRAGKARANLRAVQTSSYLRWTTGANPASSQTTLANRGISTKREIGEDQSIKKHWKSWKKWGEDRKISKRKNKVYEICFTILKVWKTKGIFATRKESDYLTLNSPDNRTICWF